MHILIVIQGDFFIFVSHIVYTLSPSGRTTKNSKCLSLEIRVDKSQNEIVFCCYTKMMLDLHDKASKRLHTFTKILDIL